MTEQERDVASELVFLAGAGNTNEAAILRGYLEHNGVYCFVQGEQHRSMMGMFGGFIELRLMVAKHQLDDAVQLLKAFHAEVHPDPGPEFRGTFRDKDKTISDGQSDDDIVDHARLAQRTANVRLRGLLRPFGGAHFAADAPRRGILLALIGIGGVVGAATLSVALLALWPVAVAFDLLSVTAPLFEQEVALARSECKQLGTGQPT